uniref:Uncharacterized protein n=1 Tax=Anguilla anguilla TaxID=7936 RepID=A0A0E9QVX7_ANGAN
MLFKGAEGYFFSIIYH